MTWSSLFLHAQFLSQSRGRTHSMFLPAKEPRPWGTHITSAGSEAYLIFVLNGGLALHGAENNLPLLRGRYHVSTPRPFVTQTSLKRRPGFLLRRHAET